MKGKGLALYPLAFYLKTHKIKSCKDFYPIEQCPREME